LSWLTIVKKELTLELRKKSVIASLVLYLFSIVFIVSLSFGQAGISPVAWAALFWISLLFTAISTIAKSFIGERRGVFIYYYYTVSPGQLIMGKLAYHALLSCLLGLGGYGLFVLFLGDPIRDHTVFLTAVVLGSVGFAGALTLISSIAAKTTNGSVLMAVLSFPLVVSILLMAVKLTKNCMDGLGWAASSDELVIVVAINSLVTALSYLLFPYIWRS
jgi:heme exporter protein B